MSGVQREEQLSELHFLQRNWNEGTEELDKQLIVAYIVLKRNDVMQLLTS
jgi:hypothetical protein